MIFFHNIENYDMNLLVYYLLLLRTVSRGCGEVNGPRVFLCVFDASKDAFILIFLAAIGIKVQITNYSAHLKT